MHPSGGNLRGPRRLIRDGRGSATGERGSEAAVSEFQEQQGLGYIGTVPDGPGKATHVREMPRAADLVIMRRPIAGG